MTDTTDAYRASLLQSVQMAQTQQRLREMSDDELQELIAQGLGLPAGTRFTDAQIDMLIEHERIIDHGNTSEGPDPV
jgi:hypothetical protein